MRVIGTLPTPSSLEPNIKTSSRTIFYAPHVPLRLLLLVFLVARPGPKAPILSSHSPSTPPFPPTMVAFLPLLSVGVTGLTLAFLLYPRLPHYSFQIRSASPNWSWGGDGFRVTLGANVELKNDNFVAIDIHALSFDIYYADWWGETQLLANVQDLRLRENDSSNNNNNNNNHRILPQGSKVHVDKNETNILEASSIDVESVRMVVSEPLPIWQLQPQTFFKTYDYVLMQPIGGLATVANVLYGMIQNGGVVNVQSTGAIHIKANGQLPLTLNILCDNVLYGFTLEMKGVHCELHRLDVGWKDIPSAMKRMGNAMLLV